MLFLSVLLLVVVVVAPLAFVAGALRARDRELRDEWRARTATLEGAGSHLSTRPD